MSAPSAGAYATPRLEPLSGGGSEGSTSPSILTLGLGGRDTQSPASPTKGSVVDHLAHEPGGIEGMRRRIPLVQERDEFVHPPENFAMMHKGAQRLASPDAHLSAVCKRSQVTAVAGRAGVYRGSFPSKRSLLFLENLHLKSILYLCPEEPPEYYTTFMRKNNVAFLHRGLTGNKEPFVEISVSMANRPAAGTRRSLMGAVASSKIQGLRVSRRVALAVHLIDTRRRWCTWLVRTGDFSG